MNQKHHVRTHPELEDVDREGGARIAVHTHTNKIQETKDKFEYNRIQ